MCITDSTSTRPRCINEYCNPMVGDGFDQFDQIRELGWWVVVTGCNGDPLIDRQMELVEMLKKSGAGRNVEEEGC